MGAGACSPGPYIRTVHNLVYCFISAAAHGVQSSVDTSAFEVPLGQGTHSTAPAVGCCVPAGQASHLKLQRLRDSLHCPLTQASPLTAYKTGLQNWSLARAPFFDIQLHVSLFMPCIRGAEAIWHRDETKLVRNIRTMRYLADSTRHRPTCGPTGGERKLEGRKVIEVTSPHELSSPLFFSGCIVVLHLILSYLILSYHISFYRKCSSYFATTLSHLTSSYLLSFYHSLLVLAKQSLLILSHLIVSNVILS